MWNLKHGTDELLYKTETDSQRTDLGFPRGRQEEEGWSRSLGLVSANYYMGNG